MVSDTAFIGKEVSSLTCETMALRGAYTGGSIFHSPPVQHRDFLQPFFSICQLSQVDSVQTWSPAVSEGGFNSF